MRSSLLIPCSLPPPHSHPESLSHLFQHFGSISQEIKAVMTSSAWQISPSAPKDWRSFEALENLHLNTTVPIPSTEAIPPKSALVRIRAAAINARDVMVIAHGISFPLIPPSLHILPSNPTQTAPRAQPTLKNISSLSPLLILTQPTVTDPIYPIPNKTNLVPCADGAGEIYAVGPDSVFKIGDRVMIHPMGWIHEEQLPDLVAMKGKGAGDIDGTLRKFGIFVRCVPPFHFPTLPFFSHSSSLLLLFKTSEHGRKDR